MHGHGVACFTAKCRRRAAAPRAPHRTFYILDVHPLPRPSLSSALSSTVTLSLSPSLSRLRYPPPPPKSFYSLPRSLVAASSYPCLLLHLRLWYHFVCLSRGGPSRRRRARCLTRVSFPTIHPRPAPPRPARVRAYIDRPCTRAPPLPRSPPPRSPSPLAMHGALRVSASRFSPRASLLVAETAESGVGLRPVCFLRVAARRELTLADVNARADFRRLALIAAGGRRAGATRWRIYALSLSEHRSPFAI